MPHLFVGMTATSKQWQSHSEASNALQGFFLKKKTIPWAKRSSNAFYRTNWGNQKGGQEHQRQFSDLVFFPQFYPANIQTSGCVLKLYNLKEKNT